MWKVALGTLGALVFCLAIGWMVQGNQFFLYKFFAPKEEAVRRETFEQSKAYRDGLFQELRQAQIDYAKATTDAQRQAISALVVHDAAGLGDAPMPDDLAAFVSQMRAVQTGGAR